MGSFTSHLRSALGRLALGLVALAPVVLAVGAARASTNPIWYLSALSLLGFGALLLYVENISVPLRRMSEASQRFASGDFSARVDESGPPQARALARSLNQMATALALRYEHVTETVQHSQEVLIALEMLAKEQSEEVAQQNFELKAQALELSDHREVLAAQNQVLVAQNEALQLASRHKSEFLAAMSHELRTPLNAVIGFSELMLEDLAGPLSPEQREFTQDILRSGRHLLAMINDILDLAKIESGRMEFRNERVDLALAAREAEEMARPMALRKGLTVELHADGSSYCTGDAQRLRQVALNLISNAVKFTPPGGKITCAVRPGADGRHVELSVSDTGIGIDPSHHERIFEKFLQVDGGNAREYEGTGLGLALVRQFAEAMGGKVTVRSQVGEGATFTVRLLADASGETSPLKVLVGSDSSGPRERLLRLLRESGYAPTGLDAAGVPAELERLRPDLVILDVSSSAFGASLMERLPGVAALVLLSPDASEEDVSRLVRLGAEVGRQSAPKSELLEVLERLTSRMAAQRAA